MGTSRGPIARCADMHPAPSWRSALREAGSLWGFAPTFVQLSQESTDEGPHWCPPLPVEDRSSSYYVVAVVKRNSSYAFTLDELRGKRSCHSAFGSPTGWDIPVGALVHRGFIRPKDCDVLTGTTLHRGTDAKTLLWGWLGQEPALGLWGPSPSRTHKRQPREIPPSSLACPLFLGRLKIFLATLTTVCEVSAWWDHGGCHGTPPTYSPRMELAPVSMGSRVHTWASGLVYHCPVMGLSPTPTGPRNLGYLAGKWPAI